MDDGGTYPFATGNVVPGNRLWVRVPCPPPAVSPRDLESYADFFVAWKASCSPILGVRIVNLQPSRDVLRGGRGWTALDVGGRVDFLFGGRTRTVADGQPEGGRLCGARSGWSRVERDPLTLGTKVGRTREGCVARIAIHARS
jgi:hypothetical protein